MIPLREEFLNIIQAIKVEHNIELANIFNYDETTVYYIMPPKSIWLPKHTKDYKIKISGNVKERVTVGLAVNAKG